MRREEAVMRYDADIEIMRRYYERFGDIGNMRQMSPDVLQKLPKMMADALARGRRLTKKELQIADVPPGANG